MAKRKTRKTRRTKSALGKSRSPRKTRKTRKTSNIIDVPFATKVSRGTRATTGNLDFHYQKYANIPNFFDTIGLTNLSNILFNVKLICIDNKMTPIYIGDLKRNKKQFAIVIINVVTNEGNHANIAIINNHNKTIEFFEPHGHRKNKNSGISNFKGLYLRKIIVLKELFNELIPGYVFINSIDHCRKTSFQSKIDPDENTGFCITWCILFIHYRCLNPDILLSKLIIYLSRVITTTKLLKYARFIEDTVKK